MRAGQVNQKHVGRTGKSETRGQGYLSSNFKVLQHLISISAFKGYVRYVVKLSMQCCGQIL